MTTTRISLGGENASRIAGGERSSRSSSTIFNKLRNLDREIGRLEHMIRFGDSWYAMIYGHGKNPQKLVIKLRERVKELDEQRKLVRLERKKYSGKYTQHE